jgi:hypothetical protein
VVSDLDYYDCPVCGALYTDAHHFCPGCTRYIRGPVPLKQPPLRPRHFLPAVVCVTIAFGTLPSFLVQHPRATVLLYAALVTVAMLPFIRRR